MAGARRARLSWRCRRGMKELDLLLLAWLETRYDDASEPERSQFESLLEQPDPELARWLMTGEPCAQPQLAAIVAAVTALPKIMSSAPAGGNHPRGAGL